MILKVILAGKMWRINIGFRAAGVLFQSVEVMFNVVCKMFDVGKPLVTFLYNTYLEEMKSICSCV